MLESDWAYFEIYGSRAVRPLFHCITTIILYLTILVFIMIRPTAHALASVINKDIITCFVCCIWGIVSVFCN